MASPPHHQDRRCTDVELERLFAGDLPDARRAELEARMTPADRQRLEQLRTSSAAFLDERDLSAEVAGIRGRLQPTAPPERRAPRWTWALSGGAVAVAAAAAVLVVARGDGARPGTDGPGAPANPPRLAVKGDAVALAVHVATPSGSRRLSPGDAVSPGQRLRFEISAAGPGYVAIVGVDGAGEVTVYHPAGGATEAAPFDPAVRLVPGAIRLDETPGTEHYYVYYAEEPFPVARAAAAVGTGAGPPSGLSMAHVAFDKDTSN